MSYKPKFCCQCSEKIERTDWKPWNSRRFCELCETEFGIHDWKARIIVIGAILFGIFGFGSYWQKSEKPLSVARSQMTDGLPNTNKIPVNQSNAPLTAANQNNQNSQAVQTGNSTRQAKSQNILQPQNAVTKKSENAAIQESVYFCGAQTKKGMPCSRRVKGGGRCWQHTGQTAMLTQDKLIAGQ